jgi:hypothetical protein
VRSQELKRSQKVIRKWSFEGHFLSCDRMLQRQSEGMQRLAGDQDIRDILR